MTTLLTVFPKGETAVLTAVEKKYGDKAIKPFGCKGEIVTRRNGELEISRCTSF